jgi:hypothetical protein
MGTRHTAQRPLALARRRTAADAEARASRQLAALGERRNPPRERERGHPPGAAIVEAEHDHCLGSPAVSSRRLDEQVLAAR